jgi:hypothetical protein
MTDVLEDIDTIRSVLIAWEKEHQTKSVWQGLPFVNCFSARKISLSRCLIKNTKWKCKGTSHEEHYS